MVNVLGYYTPLLAMLDHAVQERFLKPQNRALVLARDTPLELLKAFEDWRPVHVEKWLDQDTR
jgi:predicted Rossmann-fold nucleotide-binding protein